MPLNKNKSKAPSSLNRRRGTTSAAASRGLPRVVRHFVVLMVLVLGALVLGLGCLYTFLTGEEKKTPVDSLRHKVQAVPNLLRGRQFPNLPRSTDAGGEKVHREAASVGDAAAAGGQASQQQPHHHHHHAGVAANDHHNEHHRHHEISGGGSSGGTEYPYSLEPVPDNYDIQRDYEPKGGHRFEEYISGTAPYTWTDALLQKSNDQARSRRAFIKRAMQHAWSGYEKYAFGQDEVLPQSGAGNNNWGGQGITLVDSLDTLWLMGLKDEFWRARDWVRDHLNHATTGKVSVFETTIRDLGGLLSAYDWSGDQAFLDKALDLGTRLLRAFDGSDTGLPMGQVSLKDGSTANIPWSGNNAILAEFGTLQVENRYLSKMTGQPQFAQKTEHVFEVLQEIAPSNGLFPFYVKNNFRGVPQDVAKLKNGAPRPQFANNKLTFGAMADSLYEYMLKIWLQGGKTEPMYREMYDRAMQGMHDELLQTSTPSGLTYIADRSGSGGKIDHKMDHLVCFMGGSLALGAYTDPLGLESERAQRDLKTARALTYTCYQMYARMNTGISPEFVQFEEGRDLVIGRGAPHYLLRPEAFESFFILNHLTGDPVYREWGWECFQSIEKYCQTRLAYGELSNVADVNGKPRNKMESFFLAETLKYLYLLQDPDTEIDLLHKHVFNTEAHPTRIFPVIDADNAAAAAKR